MTALLGKGMDAADKKTQELKLQSELNRLGTSKERALANLGRAVLMQEGSNPTFVSTYADKVKVIGDLEAQEEDLRKRIESLQSSNTLVSGVAMQAANATVQGHACPSCGTPVALESMYCPACGDNLATLKAQFKRCPNCGIYYSADSAFCEKCGSRTEELEIATAASIPTSDGAEEGAVLSFNGLDPNASAATDDLDDSKACPNCGASLKPDAAFCSECGSRL